jgi:hypothetical protein
MRDDIQDLCEQLRQGDVCMHIYVHLCVWLYVCIKRVTTENDQMRDDIHDLWGSIYVLCMYTPHAHTHTYPNIHAHRYVYTHTYIHVQSNIRKRRDQILNLLPKFPAKIPANSQIFGGKKLSLWIA